MTAAVASSVAGSAAAAAAAAAGAEAADVVVVGGGVNGTGVARDLAMRGLRVVLIERNDLAFGASGNSSGMIHGGARYLASNPKVTRLSCQDSGYIQAIAPHLLFRIPFVMPFEAGWKGRALLELADAYFTAYDDFQPLKRGQPHTRLSPVDVARLEPGLVASIAGAITFDEWGIDGARLCVLNALDARERGARIHVHTTVDSIARLGGGGANGADGGPRYVVGARDLITGGALRVEARYVVNATGAWGPMTAALGGLAGPRGLGTRVRVRPGKGIHVVYAQRLTNYAITVRAIDGRQVFLEPWENMTVLGTTDDDYYGDLDDVVATGDEVRYLVQAVATVFPSILEARAIGTYAGVRPTLHGYGPREDELSREHEVVDHGADGAPGVYSLVGGKLASYRVLAQEVSDTIAEDAARFSSCATSCSTHLVALPGGGMVADAVTLAIRHSIAPVAARRLVYRQGDRAAAILERTAATPREAQVVCPCEPVLEAEVRHAVAAEMARTVDDVARRTRLGLGSCGGMRCAARCGLLVADELGLPPREGLAQARRFLLGGARRRASVLGPDQARQEAFALAQTMALLGADRSGRGP